MLSFVVSFLFVAFGMPSLIRLAFQKNLLDDPAEERKIHHRSVPRLGGVLVFLGTMITTVSMITPEEEVAVSFLRIAAASTILFFVGLKDDLTNLAPLKKLAAQVLVGLILIVSGGFAIHDFGGLFGLFNLSNWVAISFSLFVFIVVVNAVNLIDGIDTLAGGYGLLAAGVGAMWFHATGQPHFFIMCMAMGGSLTGFLIFNISPARIFIGDSGSLVLGMVVYIIATSIMSTPADMVPELWAQRSLPVLAMTTLSYPLVDTLRIFSLRTLAGRSPFSPDRNHIHHRILQLGFTHLQTAFILHTYTAAMVALGFLIPEMAPTKAFLILLGTAFMLPAAVILAEKLALVKKGVPVRS